MKRILILVEGQTEERFVKDVLAPEFIAKDIYLTATILTTKKVKSGPNFKGGVTSYTKFERDLKILLGSRGDALVTTIIDYYGLPDDFPGMSNRQGASPEEEAKHVEQSIAERLDSPYRFLPFLALHEFEAWLFSSMEVLPQIMTAPDKQWAFSQVCDAFSTPELINGGTETAPSKRILNIFPDYRKTLHGPIAADRIGLARIRSKCPHFNEWLTKIEAFAGA